MGGARGGTLWIPWDRGTPLHIQNIPHEVQKDISISLWGSGPSFVCERCGALAQMTVPILQIPLTVGVHTKHTNTHTHTMRRASATFSSLCDPGISSSGVWTEALKGGGSWLRKQLQLRRWLRVTNKKIHYGCLRRSNLSLYWINGLVFLCHILCWRVFVCACVWE